MSRRDSLVTPGCVRGLPVLVCLGAGLMLASGCESKKATPSAPAADKLPSIYTTFYPTTYFVQRIAGDKANIVCPCPADADPAVWMPDEKTIQAYQNADMIVVNGASFEKWLEKVMLPQARLVDTTKPFADEFITLERGTTHTHGPSGQHTHEGIDGHTWVDPGNAKVQATEIKKALVKKFPDHKDAFEKGCAALVKDLDALDARIKAVSAKIGDQQLLSNHPAYNYVARRYGWKMKVFYLEPEEATGEEELNKVKDFLKDHPAKHLFWEAEPAEEIAKQMKDEFGLESVFYSPCETLDPEQRKKGEDFLTVMNANVDRLEKAFGKVD
ncbi:MAG: zinc ABC transporter substrate-binding protein [Phycisphaerae bacterium]|nr:zinc ABC transporter substrate-binding protein [Phycisphaerae bacterium]